MSYADSLAPSYHTTQDVELASLDNAALQARSSSPSALSSLNPADEDLDTLPPAYDDDDDNNNSDGDDDEADQSYNGRFARSEVSECLRRSGRTRRASAKVARARLS